MRFFLGFLDIFIINQAGIPIEFTGMAIIWQVIFIEQEG
jgi:hypothetical protein